jgi:single-strand DNA-binding protein
MNVVSIIGNLTRDPKPFAENKGLGFSIAYNTRITTKDGKIKEETSFFDCVSFRNVETILKYLKKGNRVGITGELKQDHWDQNGDTRSKVVIVVNRVDFLTPKSETGEAAAPEAGETPEDASGEEETW